MTSRHFVSYSNRIAPCGSHRILSQLPLRQVYDEISPAVCGVLQGQYVCVMAYGQTGAGKTFTMQGGGAAHPGVVRLAAKGLCNLVLATLLTTPFPTPPYYMP